MKKLLSVLLALLLMLLAGCGDDSGDSDVDTDVDTDTDADSDSDTDSDTDCDGGDPCAGQTCSDHGTCLQTDCKPYCECEEGYAPGRGLTCVDASQCTLTGQECSTNFDCCSGFCFTVFPGEPGYCSLADCASDAQCTNFGDDGAEMCCTPRGAYDMCQKIAVGATCGDRSGACGAPCPGQLGTACQPDLLCVYSAEDQPRPLCGNACTTDADCESCEDSEDPTATFSCIKTASGYYCIKGYNTCDSSGDCSADQVCAALSTEDYSAIEGMCSSFGSVPTGGLCNAWNNFATSAWDDRCVGAQCLLNHCTELCETDEDCPDPLICESYYWCLDNACNNASEVKVCLWAGGSNASCTADTDCAADEICSILRTAADAYEQICITQTCDPTDAGCSATGESCGRDAEICASGLCLWGGGDEYWCAAPCETDEDCPGDMYCGSFNLGNGLKPTSCMPFEGSGTACEYDGDCFAGEVCTYVTGASGTKSACTTENEGAAAAGEECAVVADCYNDLCFTHGDGSMQCSAACRTSDDCVDGFVCSRIPLFTGGDPVPVCMKFEGSTTSCTLDADCPTGEACKYFNGLEGLEPICGTLNPDNVQVGGDCTWTDNTCYNDLCLGTGTEFYCSAVCVDSNDCPEGFICGGIGSGVEGDTQQYPACLRFAGSAAACTHDADCPAGEACKYTGGMGELESLCGTLNPDNEPVGGDCTWTDNTCYNDLCLGTGTEFYCSAICVDDDDCPEGFLCGAIGSGIEDDTQLYPSCLRFPGSQEPCTRDADCGAGESCQIYPRLDGVNEGLCCTSMNPGQQYGEQCGEGIDPCYNLLCITSRDEDVCSALCAADADCPAGATCNRFTDHALSPVGLCIDLEGSLTACAADADCTVEGEACGYAWLVGEELARGLCQTAPDDGAVAGEPCEAGWPDCASLVCSETEVCTSPCATNADCAAPGLECGVVPLSTTLDDLLAVGCVPTGADSPLCSFCADDADCEGAAKCIASLANPGEKYCGKVCAGDGDCPEGSACVDLGGGTMSCKPGGDTCWP